MNNTWRDKIQEGYIYQIGTKPAIAVTGYQGAIEYGTRLEQAGLSDLLIQQSIFITETDGLRTDTVFYPLSAVTWKRIHEYPLNYYNNYE